jgi:hypothetical protein
MVTNAGGQARAVLSGHVAVVEGRAVIGISFIGAEVPLGTVERVVRNSRMDVAWTSPVAQDSGLIGAERPVRDFTESDIRSTARLMIRANSRGVLTTVDDVNASAPFRDGDRITTLHGLVTVVPAVTDPGDSGAPALAEDGSLAGFVIGIFAGKTYLMPAGRALNEVP